MCPEISSAGCLEVGVLLRRIYWPPVVRQRTCWVAADYEAASMEVVEEVMLGFR